MWHRKMQHIKQILFTLLNIPQHTGINPYIKLIPQQ